MALRDINLIPSNILDRKEIRRHLIFWSVCLGALLSPVFGFYMYGTGVASAQKKTTINIADIDRNHNRQIEKIKQIKRRYEKEWLAHPAVVSTGIGELSSGRMGIIILVLKIDSDVLAFFPDAVEKVPVELRVTDKIEAQQAR